MKDTQSRLACNDLLGRVIRRQIQNNVFAADPMDATR